MKFNARTNQNRRLDLNMEAINAYLSRWKPGTLLDITITRHQSKRSDPMRSMYFAAVLPV